MEPADRARISRVLRYVGALVVVELALVAIRMAAPVMAPLFRPVYWVVAALFVIPIWQAARRREPGHDRRHGDRRGEV